MYLYLKSNGTSFQSEAEPITYKAEIIAGSVRCFYGESEGGYKEVKWVEVEGLVAVAVETI